MSSWIYSLSMTRQPRAKPEPWFNERTRAVRQECRRAERKWRKDKLQVSLQMFRVCWRNYQDTVKMSKKEHFSNVILSHSHNPGVLFTTIDSFLNSPHTAGLEASAQLCNNFMQFFIDKVTSIRASILRPDSDPSVCKPCSVVFNQFEPVSLSLLEDMVAQIKPSGSPCDALPPHFLKEVFPCFRHLVLALFNSSLLSGVVPTNFKHAVVHPLLKKTGLDPTVLGNYRPISKLPLLSKVLEKIVYVQLKSFLDEHNIMDVFQSGFKSLHSTETALLRVYNDILLACDSGDHVILVLLDLTAAFDTVDHSILLMRLQHQVGISGTALDWLRSYLANRTFSVKNCRI
ncbi:RNA-directed DNA polymerase from mobile element jockey [Austrofundulus limnaeus]|uniref:RNA-directed DNA polymerase from mobile element jockey n=1 Tax=Austrofundulus limnaeus TaxID=52670 RepID=A0A2I4BVR5_AUSLI|nr:PREDICTED: RNA-directed DNA polymerase from mobile element jockey-like [Austrofundulus limnaeus]